MFNWAVIFIREMEIIKRAVKGPSYSVNSSKLVTVEPIVVKSIASS